MATEKQKPCLHKTKEKKTVTVKGVEYEQTVCKSCGHVLRSQQTTDEAKGEE